jgi:uncharacterized protein (TIGR02145 family)
MKKILLSAAFIAASFTSIAQVGLGTTIPDASAALDITSTTAGLLPPRMTTAERDVINSGVWAEGLTIYNTDTKCLELYNGTDWISVCDGSVATTLNLTSQVASDNAGGTYTFLNHNLGADTSLDPHTPVVGLQGGYVQWGRRGPNTSGDSRVDWQTAGNTSNFAAAPTSGDSNNSVITGWSNTIAADYSWRTVGDVKTAADPCPAGYRVPTSSEWNDVINNNDVSRTLPWSTGDTNYGAALHFGQNAAPKTLTLPAAGYRDQSSGGLFNRGGSGQYWSSNEGGTNKAFRLSSNVTTESSGIVTGRTTGLPVRCIAE